jgi:hypothetical protein
VETGNFIRGETPPPFSLLQKRKRGRESGDWRLHKREDPLSILIITKKRGEEIAEIGDFIRGETLSPFSLLQKKRGRESGDWRLHKRGDPLSILIITKKEGKRERRLETS